LKEKAIINESNSTSYLSKEQENSIFAFNFGEEVIGWEN